MVQITFSAIFVLGAAAIAPVVALPAGPENKHLTVPTGTAPGSSNNPSIFHNPVDHHHDDPSSNSGFRNTGTVNRLLNPSPNPPHFEATQDAHPGREDRTLPPPQDQRSFLAGRLILPFPRHSSLPSSHRQSTMLPGIPHTGAVLSTHNPVDHGSLSKNMEQNHPQAPESFKDPGTSAHRPETHHVDSGPSSPGPSVQHAHTTETHPATGGGPSLKSLGKRRQVEDTPPSQAPSPSTIETHPATGGGPSLTSLGKRRQVDETPQAGPSTTGSEVGTSKKKRKIYNTTSLAKALELAREHDPDSTRY